MFAHRNTVIDKRDGSFPAFKGIPDREKVLRVWLAEESRQPSLSVTGKVLTRNQMDTIGSGDFVFHIFDTVLEARSVFDHHRKWSPSDHTEYGVLAEGEGVVMVGRGGTSGDGTNMQIDDLRRTRDTDIVGSWSLTEITEPQIGWGSTYSAQDHARKIARSLSLDVTETPVTRELLRILAQRTPGAAMIMPGADEFEDVFNDLLDPIERMFFPSVPAVRETFRREIDRRDDEMRQNMEKIAIDMLAYGKGQIDQ